MGKNRSETVVYTVYLRQCYYDILGTDRLWMIYQCPLLPNWIFLERVVLFIL